MLLLDRLLVTDSVSFPNVLFIRRFPYDDNYETEFGLAEVAKELKKVIDRYKKKTLLLCVTEEQKVSKKIVKKLGFKLTQEFINRNSGKRNYLFTMGPR